MDVLNHFYNHESDVMLGAYKGPFGRDRKSTPPGAGWLTGPYVPDLIAHSSNPVKNSQQVGDAVQVYRTALAGAKDHSVAIAAIGFATNLHALLLSPADDISPLDGRALVARKVRSVTWQGGWYSGRHIRKELAQRVAEDEFNWGCGRRWFGPSLEGCEGTASAAIKLVPSNVQQVFSEVGLFFPTGGPLLQCTTEDNPCRRALTTTLTDWGQNPADGRASWDQLVTLIAVRGVENAGAHRRGVGGTNVVQADGTNSWSMKVDSNHSYVVMDGDEAWTKQLQAAPDWEALDPEFKLQRQYNDVSFGRAPSTFAEMQSEINRLLCLPPVGKPVGG